MSTPLDRLRADLNKVQLGAKFPYSPTVDSADLSYALERIAQLEYVVDLIPDEIEVFRLMGRGGRSRADMARVVAARLERLRNAASAIEAPSGVETGNTDSTEGEGAVGDSRDAQGPSA